MVVKHSVHVCTNLTRQGYFRYFNSKFMRAWEQFKKSERGNLEFFWNLGRITINQATIMSSVVMASRRLPIKLYERSSKCLTWCYCIWIPDESRLMDWKLKQSLWILALYSCCLAAWQDGFVEPDEYLFNLVIRSNNTTRQYPARQTTVSFFESFLMTPARINFYKTLCVTAWNLSRQETLATLDLFSCSKTPLIPRTFPTIQPNASPICVNYLREKKKLRHTNTTITAPL